MPLWAILTNAGPLPSPPKGEYGCLQTNVTAALPLPGMAPTTTVTSTPAPFGNLVIEGDGRYRMTAGKNNSGAYRMDANGVVTFTGVAGSMSNQYGARGQVLYFSFRGQGTSFTCSLATGRDWGTTNPAASNNPPVNGTFQGRILFAGPGGVFSVDLRTGQQKPLGLSGNFDVRTTGETVYITDRGEMILSTSTGSGSRTIPIYGGKNYSPRFSPDGTKIAYYGGQKPRGLEAAMSAAFTNANLQPIVIDRNGTVLATLGTAYAQPTWTPDGRIVVAGSKQVGSVSADATTGIYLSDARLGNLRRIDPNFDAPHSPAVSPDGKHVAFANGPNLWVCALDGSGQRRVYEGGSQYVKYPAWSPDGKALVFTDNGIVGIVSLDGRELPVKTTGGTLARSNSEVLWLP